MLIESSLGELIRNTEQIDTTKRHHIADTVRMTGGIQFAKLEQGNILVTAKTDNGYKPTLKLPLEQSDSGSVTITLTDGTSETFNPVNMNNDDVQASCNCDDFFFRLATPSAKSGVLFGKIDHAPYIRKGTRRNNIEPITKPGLCKHLLKLTRMLRAQAIVS